MQALPVVTVRRMLVSMWVPKAIAVPDGSAVGHTFTRLGVAPRPCAIVCSEPVPVNVPRLYAVYAFTE